MRNEPVNVIGVGYVGSLISLHLADSSKEIVAVDRQDGVEDKDKWFSRYNDLEKISSDKLLRKIHTTTNYSDIKGDVSVICVNTPHNEDSADIENVIDAIESLGRTIESEHTIILRSTVPPKTCRSKLIPLLEENSGLEYGKDFNFCYAPEFVRGGKGLEDLRKPSKTVVSGNEEGRQIFRKIFPTSENLHEVPIEVAEAVKLFDNAFHGLKISLANECGRLGQEIGMDPSEVMEIISSDQKLNVSDAYMQPGKSYGGPCLEKDINILNDEAENHNTETPVLSSINPSNRKHNSWLVEKILDKNPENVGIIGATYKSDFNSTVNSPALKLAAELKQENIDAIICEPKVDIQEFRQVQPNELDEADIWIVFHEIEGFKEAKSGFSGNIIDLTEFNF